MNACDGCAADERASFSGRRHCLQNSSQVAEQLFNEVNKEQLYADSVQAGSSMSGRTQFQVIELQSMHIGIDSIEAGER